MSSVCLAFSLEEGGARGTVKEAKLAWVLQIYSNVESQHGGRVLLAPASRHGGSARSCRGSGVVHVGVRDVSPGVGVKEKYE